MKNIILFTATLFLCTFSLNAQIIVKAPNGDVGVGTDTPAEKLDVDGNAYIRGSIQLDNGAVSTISGVADDKRMVVSNNTNTLNSRAFFEMFGSTPNARRGEFVIGGRYMRFFSNVTESSFGTENMRLTNAGRLGIGISTPAALLHVNGTIMNAGGVVSSDKRLKKDIKKFKPGLNAIMKIKPYTYFYNGNAGIKTESLQVGILAQEFEEVAPYAVSQYKYEEMNIDNKVKDSGEYLCANTDVIKYMLVNAVQEQQEIIDTQNNKIDELSNEIDELKQLVKQAIGQVEIDLNSNDNNIGSLKQNTPNPFNGSTSVSYTLPKGVSTAEILVYDIQGKLITREELDVNQLQGIIEINKKNISPGIYTYSLVIDNNILDSKKMNIQ